MRQFDICHEVKERVASVSLRWAIGCFGMPGELQKSPPVANGKIGPGNRVTESIAQGDFGFN